MTGTLAVVVEETVCIATVALPLVMIVIDLPTMAMVANMTLRDIFMVTTVKMTVAANAPVIVVIGVKIAIVVVTTVVNPMTPVTVIVIDAAKIVNVALTVLTTNPVKAPRTSQSRRRKTPRSTRKTTSVNVTSSTALVSTRVRKTSKAVIKPIATILMTGTPGVKIVSLTPSAESRPPRPS